MQMLDYVVALAGEIGSFLLCIFMFLSQNLLPISGALEDSSVLTASLGLNECSRRIINHVYCAVAQPHLPNM